MRWGKGVGSSRRAGTHGQVNLWVLNILEKYHNTLIQRVLAWQLRSILARTGIACIGVVSVVAGNLSLFLRDIEVFPSLNVWRGTSPWWYNHRLL